MKKKNKINIEFIHFIEGEHFYIYDLYSEFVYYVHSNLHNYPKNIDPNRHHFRVERIPENDDHEFSLIITLGEDREHAWFAVVRALSWFRLDGYKIFNSLIKP